MKQLSLFEVSQEMPPENCYIHDSTVDPCIYNNAYICCVDCRRLGMKTKNCDPCINTSPADCDNSQLVVYADCLHESDRAKLKRCYEKLNTEYVSGLED